MGVYDSATASLSSSSRTELLSLLSVLLCAFVLIFLKMAEWLYECPSFSHQPKSKVAALL
jgi:hypothetical protein